MSSWTLKEIPHKIEEVGSLNALDSGQGYSLSFKEGSNEIIVKHTADTRAKVMEKLPEILEETLWP